MPNMVDQELVRIALDKVEGFNFERFCNSFYPAIVGKTFIPLGGVKDGGADAFDAPVYEQADRATSFYQASVGAEVDGKIRQTVLRLREFGREPKRLVYLTSRTVKYLDTLESDLTEELNVTVVIRDGAYITSHVNDGDRTRAAYNEHLAHLTNFLKSVGGSNLISASAHVREPAVVVFLSQEIARRQGDDTLVSSMTDSLILWALENTDPDKQILMSRAEIEDRINEALPSVMTLVKPRLSRRLQVLTSKTSPTGRRVRIYKTEQKYCLPFETRQHIAEENKGDQALRLKILESLDDRVRSTKREGLGDVGIRQSAEVALRSLQLTFEREGLAFASFLEHTDVDTHTTITDSIAAALDEADLHGKRRLLVADAVFDAVRGVLYSSQPHERDYLHKLARTYTLLFTLNTEPRLFDYFQDMAGDFYLYVGTDQIIRALSEHYLDPADQMTKNTLLMARRAGAKMILTEPVLDEIVWHLRTSDHEFRNVVQDIEPHMTYELARNSPKILIRAYLYARLNDALGSRRPRSWQGFAQQFLDYADLHKNAAFDDLRGYLQRAFGFEYRTRAEMSSLVDPSEYEELASALTERKNEQLARNDALMALSVFGHRIRKRERGENSEFGYRTWWLSNEATILNHTGELVERHGARYILRPDFLLNFLTLAPAASQSRAAFANIFPTLLGMTLGRRMPEKTFRKIIDQVEEAQSMDEARRGAAMAKCADRLKGDFEKQYFITNERGGEKKARVDLIAADLASGS